MSFLNTIGAASINGFQKPDVVNGPVTLQKITDSSPNFGRSIATTSDGSRIVVGDTGAANVQGRVLVYVLSNNIWNLEQTLTDGGSTGAFGTSVDISGDGNYIIVGAPSLGRVYIYERNGSVWTLIFQSAGTGNLTGQSVAIDYDGSYAVYGSPGASSNFGQITILERTGSVYSLAAQFTQTATLRMGTSVAINDDGDKIVVGYNSAFTPGQRATQTWRQNGVWTDPTTTAFGVGGDLITGPMFVDISGDGTRAIYGGPNVALYQLINPGFATFIVNIATGSVASLNFDATKILINNRYYTGFDQNWNLITTYRFPSNVITNAISSDGNYLIFVAQETTGERAIFIFES